MNISSCMDTAKTLLRQLRYCEAAAETPEQVEQVRWWIELIQENRADQPPADPITPKTEAAA